MGIQQSAFIYGVTIKIDFYPGTRRLTYGFMQILS